MTSRSRHHRKKTVAAVLALGAAVVMTAPAATALVAGTPVARQVIADPLAQGAPGWRLVQTTVSIASGARIAKHRHAGTQIAAVTNGTLHYTVYAGAVEVYRKSAGGPVYNRTIKAGMTDMVRSGETLVEQPRDIHEAENRGSTPVRITTSGLFPKDAPLSIAVP